MVLYPLVTHTTVTPEPEDAMRAWLTAELRALGLARMDATTGDIEPEWAASAAENTGLTCWVRKSKAFTNRPDRVAYDSADDRLMAWIGGRSGRIFATARSPKASLAPRSAVAEWLRAQDLPVRGASDAA